MTMPGRGRGASSRSPDRSARRACSRSANQKGGVTKTTSTVNLGAALVERGFRVLAIDLDPQSNLTMSLGVDPETLERSMFDVLVSKVPLDEIIAQRRSSTSRPRRSTSPAPTSPSRR